jgi:hypothetical protein
MLADGVGGNGNVAPPGSFGATTPPVELMLSFVVASDMAAPRLEAALVSDRSGIARSETESTSNFRCAGRIDLPNPDESLGNGP